MRYCRGTTEIHSAIIASSKPTYFILILVVLGVTELETILETKFVRKMMCGKREKQSWHDKISASFIFSDFSDLEKK
jgi:hypothetical protein